MKTKLILFLALLCTTLGLYISAIFPSKAKEAVFIEQPIKRTPPKVDKTPERRKQSSQVASAPIPVKQALLKPNPLIQGVEANSVCAAAQFTDYENYLNMDTVGDFILYHNPDSEVREFFSEVGPLRRKSSKKISDWKNKDFQFIFALRMMNDSSLAESSRNKEEAHKIFKKLSEENSGSLLYAMAVIYAEKKMGLETKKILESVREASRKSGWSQSANDILKSIHQISWMSPKHLVVVNNMLSIVDNKIYGDFFETVRSAINEVDAVERTAYGNEIAETIASELVRSRSGNRSGGYSWDLFYFTRALLKDNKFRGDDFNSNYLENQIDPTAANLPYRPYVGKGDCNDERERMLENYFYENRSFY
ncbi:MAG: hypothetical protein M9962_05275 [Oligoflexia bacterium]|nr:hypothetical protein [Oligoflexia bacterium]